MNETTLFKHWQFTSWKPWFHSVTNSVHPLIRGGGSLHALQFVIIQKVVFQNNGKLNKVFNVQPLRKY